MRVRDVAEHNVMIYECTRAVECVLIAVRSVHRYFMLRIIYMKYLPTSSILYNIIRLLVEL